MAEDLQSKWGQLLQAALDRNKGTERPDSWRALNTALASADGSKNYDTWDKYIRTIKEEGTSTERDAQLIATVLGVPRDELPSAKKVTSRTLLVRLEGLEGALLEILDGQRELARLQKQLVQLSLPGVDESPEQASEDL